MGLFELLSWAVALVCPLLAGWGLTILAPPHDSFRGARVCFYTSALFLWGYAVAWGFRSNDSLPLALTVTGLLATTAAVGLVLALRTVTARETANSSARPPAQAVVSPGSVQGPLPLSIIGLQEPNYHRYSGLLLTPDGSLDRRDPPMLVMPDVYISNTSPDRAVTLRISLQVQGENGFNTTLKGDGEGGIGRQLGRDDFATRLFKRAGGEGPKFIVSPVTIQPRQTVHGKLPFVATMFGMDDQLDEKLLVALARGSTGAGAPKFVYTLHINDVVSNNSISLPVSTSAPPQAAAPQASRAPARWKVVGAQLNHKVDVANLKPEYRLILSLKNVGELPGTKAQVVHQMKAAAGRLNNSEMDETFAKTLYPRLGKDAPPSEGATLIDVGETIHGELYPPALLPEIVVPVARGEARLYLMAIVSWRDAETPRGKYWISEFCASLTGDMTEMEFCDKHNSLPRLWP